MKRSELKQLIKEAIEEVQLDTPPMEEAKKEKEGVHLADDIKDEVGSFFVVEKPGNKSTVSDIVIECGDIAYFVNQVRGGLKLEDIKGVFTKAEKAKKLAEKLIDERDKKKEEVKKQAEAYKKMKEETLAKVQEYMKTKGETKEVVDELTQTIK